MVGRPWQVARVARAGQSWLPATWLGSAWSLDNGQDHTRLMEKLRFTLVREEGEVLEGRLGVSCKKKVRNKTCGICFFFKLYILYTTWISASSF